MKGGGNILYQSPLQKPDELEKSLKKGVMLVIFDEMEKVRRYWAFRFARLLQMGLEAQSTVDLKFSANKMILTITVAVPEEFYDKSVVEILRKRERRTVQRPTWGMERTVEEELLSEEGDKNNIEEEDVEVELIEGGKNTSSR